MQRNEKNKILCRPLSKFEIRENDVTEDNILYEDIWNCIYEQIEVYTMKGTALIAYKYCGNGYLITFDKLKETKHTKEFLKKDHPHHIDMISKNWGQYNAYHNCLGFCVLDGDYWLDLNKSNLDTIIKDEQYELVNEDFTSDHLLIYYDHDNPIHIAKYNSNDKMFEHKVGCNCIVNVKTSDASQIYKYDKLVRYRMTF